MPQKKEKKIYSKWNNPFIIAVKYSLTLFCWGCPLDISLVHGVSPSEVQFSVWKVVDAVHQNKALKIDYPSCHDKQRKIADEFKNLSYAGFDNCAGCIDGLLIWICKPNGK